MQILKVPISLGLYPMTDNTEKTPQVDDSTSDSYNSDRISGDVVKALKEGNYKAYDIIHTAYRESIKKFLLKITGSNQDAEEMLQEIFVNVWIKRAQIDPDKNFKVYLYSIVRDALFKQKKNNSNPDEVVEPDPNSIPDESLLNNMIIASEIRLIIDIAAGNMPELRRNVYEMRLEGISYDNIASKLNITPNSARQHFSRALKDIKKLIMLLISFMD